MAEAQKAHVPPQNIEAEESVLGAMMVSEPAITRVIDEVKLKAEDFYRDRHRAIFAAIWQLYHDSKPVDQLTVIELLGQRNELDAAGGKDVVATLAATVPAPGNARHYAEIVQQHALLRRLLDASHRIQASVQERQAEPRELAERAERMLFEVAHEERASDFRSLGEVLSDEVDKLEALSKGDGEITGTPSGFRDIDAVTGGFQPGNFVVIAARPSMGKSSLVANIAENVAVKYQRPVALFSLEMSETELAQRFIAIRARKSGDQLRKGQVSPKDWPDVVRACNELERAPLWIDDSADLGLLDLRAKARRLHAAEQAQGGLGLVIVDYLQLMRPEDPRVNRVEQVGQMSRGLKILAGELQVPVIGVSQLSRAPELRPDKKKKPILSDLRESGCLTGDALVYLPETGKYQRIDELEGRSGFSVLALDTKTWKLEPRRVTAAFSTGRKPVYRLSTALGRTIRATGNHKFLTINGWEHLDRLEPGTQVALPRQLPSPAEATMSESELALLGHLIGDGCTLPRHAIQYTTKDPGLAQIVVDLTREVFGTEISPRVQRERTWYQVYLPSARRLTHGVRNPIATWLDRMGAFGHRAPEKRIPDAVFRQPASRIADFLCHLWSTDGCVLLGRTPAVYYASSSERLARGVQSLLLRVGINATLRKVDHKRGLPGYQVWVTGGPDLWRFLQEIGGLGDEKGAQHMAILKYLYDREPNTNRDIVPREAWQRFVKPAMATAGLTARGMQAAIDTQYCGSTLYKANLSRGRALRVAEAVDSTELRRLATSDVYWDRIKSIEPDGKEDVFDMTVEGLHSFVANDIVVHNSIEQDADLVAFIYRDEYYNEDSEDKGLADIIIAKHRNGPTRDVKLVFIPKFPKFADRAREAAAAAPPGQLAEPIADASSEGA